MTYNYVHMYMYNINSIGLTRTVRTVLDRVIILNSHTDFTYFRLSIYLHWKSNLRTKIKRQIYPAQMVINDGKNVPQ